MSVLHTLGPGSVSNLSCQSLDNSGALVVAISICVEYYFQESTFHLKTEI